MVSDLIRVLNVVCAYYEICMQINITLFIDQ